MSNRSTGDWGEYLTAFLLSKRFEAQGLVVLRVGSEDLPYDLLIPHPVAGTPFDRPTALNVKTRGQAWSTYTPPNREELARLQQELGATGYAYWIAFVKFGLAGDRLTFGVYLLPSDRLAGDDFQRVTRRNGPEDQIITARLMQKAALRFISAEEAAADLDAAPPVTLPANVSPLAMPPESE
jgi:hypothetical protein